MFKPEQRYLVLDYETYSETDLTEVGAYEYSMHPTTDIICAAWRVGTKRQLAETKKARWWAPAHSDGDRHFKHLFKALTDPSIIIVAHNALFEQVITRNVFATKHMKSKHAELQIPPSRWLCTASLAASLALPRNLEGAAQTLKLPVQKDMDGRRLVLKWCKPRPLKAGDPKGAPRVRWNDEGELNRLVRYCRTDVAAEVALFLKAPPLTRTEREVWELDQAINLRGFQVDRPLVKTIIKMIAQENEVLNAETVEITDGAVTSISQREKVLAFVLSFGILMPNLTAAAVDELLEDTNVNWGGREPARRLLEIRQALSKTSTKKYPAFECRSRFDGRCRDILMYHAASTGRWGGTGVQPQNFPRGTFAKSEMHEIFQTVARGDLEMVRMLHGSPLDVFAACLRGMIVAPDGKLFDVADYNAIEARVLFWVAKHEAGIRAFAEGKDLYREQAAEIFGRPADSFADDSLERFLGKSAVLGCGYAMGAAKFAGTCEAQGRKVPMELAERAVKSYRKKHAPVVSLWHAFEKAARAAIENPGTRYTLNYTKWSYDGEFLWVELPSRRRLAFYNPRIVWETTTWGDRRPGIRHWGIDSKTKQWVEQKTYGGKLVENVVQAVARDLMAEAMLRIERAGPWQIVLTVHDELVAERSLRPGAGGTFAEFKALMEQLPAWAAGCPVKAAGWSGDRYRK